MKEEEYIKKRIKIISDFGLELPDEIRNRILSAKSEVDADRIITDFILNSKLDDDKTAYKSLTVRRAMPDCFYNDAVACESHKCETCGWNPHYKSIRKKYRRIELKYNWRPTEKCWK